MHCLLRQPCLQPLELTDPLRIQLLGMGGHARGTLQGFATQCSGFVLCAPAAEDGDITRTGFESGEVVDHDGELFAGLGLFAQCGKGAGIDQMTTRRTIVRVAGDQGVEGGARRRGIATLKLRFSQFHFDIRIVGMHAGQRADTR